MFRSCEANASIQGQFDLTRETLHINYKEVIKTFKHRSLKRFFEHGDSRRLPPDMVVKIETILLRLESAKTIQGMNMHSFNLHELTGNRKGTWSVTTRANWRITFRFEGEDVFDVNLEDYH